MTLRLIARELYRVQQEVDRIDQALADSTLAGRDALKLKLARVKKERDQIRQMLDGHLDR